MADLPVMLRVEGMPCVVVGGGRVGRRRTFALIEAGGQVRVIAPEVDSAMESTRADIARRPYRRGDLEGARLVVIATDDPATNEQVARDASERGLLINRADNPRSGDLTIPAHARHGPVTLAVDTAGTSAQAAGMIRRELSGKLDPDWPRLLEAAVPYRERIQRQFPEPDERRRRLKRLTDPAAMHRLKSEGLDALHQHWEHAIFHR